MSFSLTKTEIELPAAPAALKLISAFRLDPPPGAHLGKVVGITRTGSGSIVAATDRGLWVRVPVKGDESFTPLTGPVAMSIRDLPAPPSSMVFSGAIGEPGFVGTNVWVSVPTEDHLLSYEIGGCFPSAHPQPALAVPKGEDVFRLEAGFGGDPAIILENQRGRLRYVWPFKGDQADRPPAVVRRATASAHIPLAAGCDTLTFQADGAASVVRTSCSPGFDARMAALWAQPQHQHRQPDAVEGDRLIGRISAPVVAVSEAHSDGDGIPLGPVMRGDKETPGPHCSILIAAQAKADAPIFIYEARPRCAYYPRDPSGAPFPPPPPPA